MESSYFPIFSNFGRFWTILNGMTFMAGTIDELTHIIAEHFRQGMVDTGVNHML